MRKNSPLTTTANTRRPPDNVGAPDPHRCLRPPAAADRVGLSVKTLEALRHRGGGPRFAKLSSRIIYRVSDLDEWVAARLRSNTAA
jgi:predicted DNA-binding transcriptional regulator AlpA